jgi:hypothetical protein
MAAAAALLLLAPLARFSSFVVCRRCGSGTEAVHFSEIGALLGSCRKTEIILVCITGDYFSPASKVKITEVVVM